MLNKPPKKALKAAHLHYGLNFRYTHDIGELIENLKQHEVSVPASVEEVISLSIYASEARYPSLDEPVSEEEYNEAIALAEKAVNWVASQLEHR